MRTPEEMREIADEWNTQNETVITTAWLVCAELTERLDRIVEYVIARERDQGRTHELLLQIVERLPDPGYWPNGNIIPDGFVLPEAPPAPDFEVKGDGTGKALPPITTEICHGVSGDGEPVHPDAGKEIRGASVPDSSKAPSRVCECDPATDAERAGTWRTIGPPGWSCRECGGLIARARVVRDGDLVDPQERIAELPRPTVGGKLESDVYEGSPPMDPRTAKVCRGPQAPEDPKPGEPDVPLACLRIINARLRALDLLDILDALDAGDGGPDRERTIAHLSRIAPDLQEALRVLRHEDPKKDSTQPTA